MAHLFVFLVTFSITSLILKRSSTNILTELLLVLLGFYPLLLLDLPVITISWLS